MTAQMIASARLPGARPQRVRFGHMPRLASKFEYHLYWNAHRDEFVRKTLDGSLKPEEKAEVLALLEFGEPDSFELAYKDYLGTLTDAEAQRFKDVVEKRVPPLPERYGGDVPPESVPFGPLDRNALQTLVNCSYDGHPKVTELAMDTGQTIHMTPREVKDKTLFTYGLTGCLVPTLITDHEDGSKTAVMTHYPPGKMGLHLFKLRQLLSNKPELQQGQSQAYVSIMGMTQEPSPDGTPKGGTPHPEGLFSAKILQWAMEHHLKKPVSSQVLTYPALKIPKSPLMLNQALALVLKPGAKVLHHLKTSWGFQDPVLETAPSPPVVARPRKYYADCAP